GERKDRAGRSYFETPQAGFSGLVVRNGRAEPGRTCLRPPSDQTGLKAPAPMKIHEYQAKALLREFGVPVPRGEVATTPAEAKTAAARLGGRVVVKGRGPAGGRGKAGGIKGADDADGAERAARQILGMRLKSPQTPPGGIDVHSVLVEEASDVAGEGYLPVPLGAPPSHLVAF